MDRARARGTLDHDARRAHAIDDPRRDRGRRDARDDVEAPPPLVGAHAYLPGVDAGARRDATTGHATGDARTTRARIDRSIDRGRAIDRDGRREKRANGGVRGGSGRWEIQRSVARETGRGRDSGKRRGGGDRDARGGGANEGARGDAGRRGAWSDD